MLYLGPHYSIAKGVINAIKDVQEMDGTAMQIFTGSPQSLELGKLFSESDEYLEEIKKFIEKNNFPVFIHAKYLLNFAKPLIPKNKIFLVRYTQDLNISVKMGMRGVVLHFGTASNGMDKEEARKNMVKSLISCLDHADKKSVPILETSSGEGNYIGRTIEGIRDMYKALPTKYQKRIKFCVDTCHIFVSGYPIQRPGGWNNYVKMFEKEIGKNKITVIHLNDSATPFDEKNDRHADIGDGYIFNPKMGGSVEALKEILEWADKNNVPCILETHKDFPGQIKYCRKILDSNIKINNKIGGKNKRDDLIESFRQLMNFHKALGNIHQFQAYKNVVNKLSQREKIKSVENVKDIEGFGAGILGKIDEFFATGKMQVLEEMKKDDKLVALVNLQKVYGIGPKFAQKLIADGIMNVEQLRKEFNAGRINLTENQQVGLKYFDDLNTRIPREDAERMVEDIRKLLGNKEVLLMGGYRLGKKDGKDLDLVVVNEEMEELMSKLGRNVVAVLEMGSNMMAALMKFTGYGRVVHVDFRLAPEDRRAFFTLYFGSGENFSRKIRQIAKDKGYTLNEYGLRKKDGKFVEGKFEKEEDIFKFLGVEYVKPEDRL